MTIVVIVIMTAQVTYFEISRDESWKASWRREFSSEHQIRNDVYIWVGIWRFEMEENIAEIVNEILSLLQRCTSWLWSWVNKSDRRNMDGKEKCVILLRTLVHDAESVMEYLKFCVWIMQVHHAIKSCIWKITWVP